MRREDEPGGAGACSSPSSPARRAALAAPPRRRRRPARRRRASRRRRGSRGSARPARSVRGPIGRRLSRGGGRAGRGRGAVAPRRAACCARPPARPAAAPRSPRARARGTGRARGPATVTGPIATRRSFETGCPTASSSRFTSCCLPSCSVTSTQALLSASITRARSTAMKSPSTCTPRCSRSSVSRVGHAVHLGVVDARHLVARVRHALGEGAVVRQQDQALGGHVEPADREQARHRRHQVHHGRPPLGVAARADDAARLVEHQVDGRLRRLDADAVDADVVLLEVGLGAELAHGLAVDA